MSELGLIEPVVVTWTDKRVEELKRLAPDYSAAQIAAMLGYVTRNAVLGKLNRLGLCNPRVKTMPQPKIDRPGRSSNNHQSVFKIVMNGGGPTLLETTISKEAIKLRCAEITPRNLTLMELEAEDCRWPYGEGPFVFCGHPVFHGPYCASHKALAIGHGTGSERAASRASL